MPKKRRDSRKDTVRDVLKDLEALEAHPEIGAEIGAFLADLREADPDDPWPVNALEEFAEWLDDHLSQKLQQLVTSLLPEEQSGPGLKAMAYRSEKWTAVATNAKQFKQELQKTLDLIEECMIVLYDVGETRGRIQRHSGRDSKIYDLRISGKKFAYIGRQVNLTRNVARQAFEREAKRREAEEEKQFQKLRLLKQLIDSNQ